MLMDKEKYITKKYFDEHTRQFATKKDIEAYKDSSDKHLELLLADSKRHVDNLRFEAKRELEKAMIDSKQHAKDLKTYFSDSLMGIGEYVKSVDEKVEGLGEKFVILDEKVDKLGVDMTSVKDDISLIKNVLEEKASKKEVADLKNRVVHLEAKAA